LADFDVLVVGSGSGMTIVANAVALGMKVALVEKGPMGGTCLNRGCIPSKMLLYPADVVALVKEAKKLGIEATLNKIDFHAIMERMRRIVHEDSSSQAAGVERDRRITWFKDVGEFVSDYTMKVKDRKLNADKIFIVSGARCYKPPIKGLSQINYLTSENLLELDEPPRSIVIVGGGFVAVEYAHFFSQMGAKVSILQRAPRLLPDVEPEISELLASEMRRYVDVFTNHEAVEARETKDMKVVIARDRTSGKMREFSAESVMLAAGRASNADLTKPEKTGVDLDERGFIKVNQYLETSKSNIWAFGDAIGKHMFKHVANYEAEVVWHNVFGHPGHKIKADYSAIPFAVFSHPEIASVGLTEKQARDKGHEVAVGRADYKDTAKGLAMSEPEGFVKIIADAKTGRILGGHIIGPQASILIQEIINVMECREENYGAVLRALHIHPALPEVVQRAVGSIQIHTHQ